MKSREQAFKEMLEKKLPANKSLILTRSNLKDN